MSVCCASADGSDRAEHFDKVDLVDEADEILEPDMDRRVCDRVDRLEATDGVEVLPEVIETLVVVVGVGD